MTWLQVIAWSPLGSIFLEPSASPLFVMVAMSELLSKSHPFTVVGNTNYRIQYRTPYTVELMVFSSSKGSLTSAHRSCSVTFVV